MQEVFEKIIYDKVLSKAWQPLGIFDENSPLVIKVSDVKEIVKQATAEYNDGWILVEDRLPEDGEEVLATDGEYVYLVEFDADLDAGFGDMDGIVAWQPLPEPYQPKGE